ncbi:MAG: hypothetical protein QXI51_04700 [Candidatus Korarchaeum sp.]
MERDSNGIVVKLRECLQIGCNGRSVLEIKLAKGSENISLSIGREWGSRAENTEIYVRLDEGYEFQGKIMFNGISIKELCILLNESFDGEINLSNASVDDLSFNIKRSKKGVPKAKGLISINESSVKEFSLEEQFEDNSLEGDSSEKFFSLRRLTLSNETKFENVVIAASVDEIELNDMSAQEITIRTPSESADYVVHIGKINVTRSNIQRLDLNPGVIVEELRVSRHERDGKTRIEEAYLSSKLSGKAISLKKAILSAEFGKLKLEFRMKDNQGYEGEDSVIILNGVEISRSLTISVDSSPSGSDQHEKPQKPFGPMGPHPYLIGLHDLRSSEFSNETQLSLRGVDLSRVLITGSQLSKVELIDCIWDRCEIGDPKSSKESNNSIRRAYSIIKSKLMSKGIFLPSTIAMLVKEGVLNLEDLPHDGPFRIVKKLLTGSSGDLRIPLEEIRVDSLRSVNSKVREFMEAGPSNFEISGKVFIGDMKAIRYIRRSRGDVWYRFFSSMYDILSAYGESFIRPLVFILIISLIPTLLDIGSHPLQLLLKYLENLSEIIVFFYGVGKPSGNILMVLLKFLGAILLGLEFISLKRVFERRFWR